MDLKPSVFTIMECPPDGFGLPALHVPRVFSDPRAHFICVQVGPAVVRSFTLGIVPSWWGQMTLHPILPREMGFRQQHHARPHTCTKVYQAWDSESLLTRKCWSCVPSTLSTMQEVMLSPTFPGWELCQRPWVWAVSPLWDVSATLVALACDPSFSTVQPDF